MAEDANIAGLPVQVLLEDLQKKLRRLTRKSGLKYLLLVSNPKEDPKLQSPTHLYVIFPRRVRQADTARIVINVPEAQFMCMHQHNSTEPRTFELADPETAVNLAKWLLSIRKDMKL